MKKQNYNPNSYEHNDNYYKNDYDEDFWGSVDASSDNCPSHRKGYLYFGYDYKNGQTEEKEFNTSTNFLHKLDEIPKEANVPPELLRDMFNGLVVKLNKLIDWHNSLEEYEFDKIKEQIKKKRGK